MPLDDRLVEYTCPAKINLTLAILGKQADGFHALHSIVAQTGFGDRLQIAWEAEGDPTGDKVSITGSDLPADDNSVATAIRLFREVSGFDAGAFIAVLEKRIPAGAGLGGGSSDAVAALKGIRRLVGDTIPGLNWLELASRIGSDCPLFFHDGPVIMEGRGERITPLSAQLSERLSGLPVALFKPDFPINTAEAYRHLAAAVLYTPQAEAERSLQDWQAGEMTLPQGGNDFERLVEDWIPSIPVVLRRLREQYGLDARMSGSGSACFALCEGKESLFEEIKKELVEAWGPHYWLVKTAIK
ncbi:MAG TPA: 4-(cytidine 5'-diphospho)-2-C-methyl-D-erythritol kinase [Oceanipulchritudo sp.]|nr:4-(cytidine 5'-diphospho)-2-C-methyl-D-erythritol kinase [Oceanipulchritudo sp.]